MPAECVADAPIDVVDKLRESKGLAEAKYRKLVCLIAEGSDVDQDELNAAMAQTGFSLADAERHVQIARCRRKAVKDKERADKEAVTVAELQKQIGAKRSWCDAEMKRMNKKLEAAHEEIDGLQGRVGEIHRRQQDAAKEFGKMQRNHVRIDLKARFDQLNRERMEVHNSVRGLSELRDQFAKKLKSRDQLADRLEGISDAERESSRSRSLDESLSRLNHKAERYTETVEALKEQSARLSRIENEISQTTREMSSWQNFELDGEENR